MINQSLLPYVEKVLTYLDSDFGGFKGNPKFPQFYIFDCLFYYYKKTQKSSQKGEIFPLNLFIFVSNV